MVDHTWFNIPDNIKDYHGFVYHIIEKDTGMIYIGSTVFWNKRTLKPLKGKRNKRHKLVESKWREYNTSSPIMQEKLEKNPDNYKKICVRPCKSVSEKKCYEIFTILEYLFLYGWDKVYNENVNVRTRVRKGVEWRK